MSQLMSHHLMKKKCSVHSFATYFYLQCIKFLNQLIEGNTLTEFDDKKIEIFKNERFSTENSNISEKQPKLGCPPVTKISHLYDVFLVCGVRNAFDIKKKSFSVRNQAPVLHGTGGEVGDGGHVRLGQRVGDSKKFFVKLKNFGSVFRS